MAELADPRFASIDLAPDPMHCEGGCAEGFACLRMRIPSITDPAQSSTGYGCAPMGSAATTASPIPNVLFAVAAPSGSPQPVEGLEPGADGRVAGAISIATGIDSCGGACGVGYTCLSITIPSLSDPAQTTTRFGCAPTGVDPFTGTPTVAPAPSGTAQPVEGLEPPVDARLAGTIQIATDAMQCDGGRGCGEGFTCMRMEVPSLSSPSQTTTRYGCAPSSRTALACARTGLLFDPATGECVWPVVAAAGEACGASRPGVVCAEAGRCVRRQDGESVCVAASPVGGECFTDRTAGPGCMTPAFCAREGGAEVGTCTRPEPPACGE